MRWCATGAAVAAAAALGLGGASAAMAAPVVVIPVTCSVNSLSHAINFAPSDAILSLETGCVYRLSGSLPDVTSNLTIQGNGDVITRRGNAVFTALTDDGARLAINRLTMTDFDGNILSPGALTNNGGTVTITKSSFADNAGSLGGAIRNTNGGNLSATSTNFVDNLAFFGGAIYNGSTSTAVLSTDEFADNRAGSGGAILNMGHLTVTGYSSSISGSSNFAGNVARGLLGAVKSPAPLILSGYGGAIDNFLGTLTVAFTNFTENAASNDGGAVWNGGSAGTIDSSGFTGNFADDDGGAIATISSLSLSRDTVSLNRANDDGGGIYVNGGTTSLSRTDVLTNSAGGTGGGIRRSSGFVSLTNFSLVALNHPNNCSGLFC
ncbi:MAG TPA: hypothetical protein VMV07_18365 [Streptosporangiaceae bacterium]|nr:hypothetical protein [Streptosporangiaceae bacterium]